MEFSYFLPTKLSFGFGSVEGVGAEAKGLGATQALVVTDKIMVKKGIQQKATDSLGGTPFDIFDDVRELGIEGLDHYYETKSIQVLECGKGKRWAFPIN